MAQITNQTLTLTPFIESGVPKVKIEVEYDAIFSEDERNFTTLPFEWKFLETIQVIGVDPDTSTIGQILVEKMLPVQEILVTPVGTGTGPETVHRLRTMKVLRTLLNEDPALGLGPAAEDDIRCLIQILPVAASEFTSVKHIFA